MALTVWDPFTALARFDREFDDIVRRGFGATAGRFGYVPPVEVITRDGDVVIRLELPGVATEDVGVEVLDHTLVIRGERRDRRDEQSGSYLVRELRYGSFRREFALPEGVTADDVEAHYDQGMLEVLVRNAVRRDPEPRQVKINTRSGGAAIEATSEPAG
jgi:HSP20 family protein